MQTINIPQASIQKTPLDNHSLEAAFAESYLDESSSAIKLLLPPLTGKNILYIGADVKETAKNISFSCDHLTAIYVTTQSYNAQLEKIQFRPHPSNIDILFWDTKSTLSLEHRMFDGIIIDQALRTMCKSLQETNFANILSYLNKNSWVFIKAKNSLDRNKLIQKIKHPNVLLVKSTLEKNYYRNTVFYKQLLKKNNLIEYKTYSFDHYSLQTDNIINLNSKAEVAAFCKHEKFKYLPFQLYKLTTPIIGIFATNYKPRNAPDSILNLIIYESLNILGSDKFNIQSIEVNRKSKCVITLEVFRPYAEQVMIKIPLSKLANEHLHHGYNGLKLINNALASCRTSNPSHHLFPKAFGNGCIGRTHFYIESKLDIVEPKNNKNILINAAKIKEITNALLNIRQISMPKNSDKGKHNTLYSILLIKSFLEKNQPQRTAQFIELTKEIEQNANNKHTCYFYKSDFSMSNTFFEQDKIQGILDFEFWGFSHNKLVDFGDFVLSCTRKLYGIQYKEALLEIAKGNLAYFPEALNLEYNINHLNSTVEEFQEAAMIAWLNSIAHLLEFEHIKFNQKRLEPILIDPLHALTTTLV